jgi:hypothetical protein
LLSHQSVNFLSNISNGTKHGDALFELSTPVFFLVFLKSQSLRLTFQTRWMHDLIFNPKTPVIF